MASIFNLRKILKEYNNYFSKRIINNLKKGKINRKDIATGILLAVIDSHLKTKPKRKAFSKSTQKVARERQENRCNRCHKKTDIWEYDHLNGDSSDNSLENCQPMCPNCHARKTRKIKAKQKQLSRILNSLKSALKNLKYFT